MAVALRSRVLDRLELDTNLGIDFKRRNLSQAQEKHVVEDLVTKGVIDPVLVVKNSMLYGASIASILLTADCAVLQDDGRIHEHEELRL